MTPAESDLQANFPSSNGPICPTGVASTAVEALSTLLFPEGRLASSAAKKIISTGRTTPKNLTEKLAMEEVMANPSGFTPPRLPKMSDTKNNLLAKDGWVKRVQNVNGVEIHYVENINTKQVLDFKFP